MIVDCSASNPVSTLAFAEEAKAKSVHFVDAPLSRAPKEAEAGTLDTMVGAEPEVLARIEPVLRAWAGNVAHLGPMGPGHKMELVNNFIAMGYAAMHAAGQGERFVPMLADFIAGLNGLKPAGSDR